MERLGRWVKRIFGAVGVLIVLVSGICISQYELLYGPNLKVSSTEISLSPDIQKASGWDEVKLQSIMEYMDEAGSTSVIIIQDGQLVGRMGQNQ